MKKRNNVLRAALFAANYAFLFFTSDRIQPTHLTQGFLLLLTVASVWCFNRKSGCMEKYRAKGSRAAIGIIAVYASLASFAQRFFLDGNTRMHFSLPGLFYVLSGILWFIPVIRLLLFALEWLSARPRTLPKPGSRKKALCVLLIALLLCQVFVLWVEWPGGFPLDAVYQYRQAMGELPLSDDHPVLDTLLMRVVLTVFPHPAALTAVQLLLFSLVLCAFLMMGYDRGVPLPLLLGVAAVRADAESGAQLDNRTKGFSVHARAFMGYISPFAACARYAAQPEMAVLRLSCAGHLSRVPPAAQRRRARGGDDRSLYRAHRPAL